MLGSHLVCPLCSVRFEARYYLCDLHKNYDLARIVVGCPGKSLEFSKGIGDVAIHDVVLSMGSIDLDQPTVQMAVRFLAVTPSALGASEDLLNFDPTGFQARLY